jgi:hypothetical protein
MPVKAFFKINFSENIIDSEKICQNVFIGELLDFVQLQNYTKKITPSHHTEGVISTPVSVTPDQVTFT